MQITDKLLKPITETKYLTTENAERHRTILRIFYLLYEKLKYWLYQEDIYQEMISHDYFKDYRMEQSPVKRKNRELYWQIRRFHNGKKV